MFLLQWGQTVPRAAPSGGRVVAASFPARHSGELLGGVLDHGPLQGKCHAVS
jgi:hypothetical protein